MLTVATVLKGTAALVGVALVTAMGAGAVQHVRSGARTPAGSDVRARAVLDSDRLPTSAIGLRAKTDIAQRGPAALLSVPLSRLISDPEAMKAYEGLSLAAWERDETLLPEPSILLDAPALLNAAVATDRPVREWDSITGSVKRRPGAISILQIGDSHTAADYFTGEVRRQLQARYGDGGAGYLEVGTPHVGVLSARFKVSASSGWAYSGIQKSSSGADFALSGFSASTAKAGEKLSFSAAEEGVPYTTIDIEVQKGPNEGSVAIDLDGREVTTLSLAAPDQHRELVRVASSGKRVATMRRVEIRTLESKPVTALSVAIVNRKYGVTYSNVGFPGATVDILNKFPQETVVEALSRLTPTIVVLAFGTNEGFNDALDLGKYQERYLAVIRTIRSGAPKARIVMVGPSAAHRVPSGCVREPNSAGCEASRAEQKSAANADRGDEAPCTWPTPPQLDRVRDVQRQIALSEGIDFWDWSALMPKRCGAQAWTKMSPPLMAGDLVHFTKEGYRRSGRAFAAFLDPFVRRSFRDTHAVSNH